MIAAVFAGLLLYGCSYWDDTMSFVGLGDSDEEAQPAAAPAAEAAPAPALMPSSQYSTNEDWCRQIAKAAGEEAAGEGLDAAIQQRRADTTYRQCSENSRSR
ncbi:MAG: hypothetical protein ABSD21_12375 [Rhizomicrobium sp.]